MLPIFIDREDERNKETQSFLKAQFASERPKSRSRFFERVGNRWGVEKFLRSKPKIKISAKRSKKVAKKEPQRKPKSKVTK